MVRVLAQKYSVAEISSRLSISRNAVAAYLQEIGVVVEASYVSNPLLRHVLVNVVQLSKKWVFSHRFIFIGLAIMVLAVYVNSINNAFVSDDLPLIHDPQLGSFEYAVHDPRNILRTVLYTITYHLFGTSPAAFRIPSILFHIANAWLVFTLVWLITKTRTALIASAIFAVHPLFSEPVIWISGGIYPQYSMMVLAGIICYILGLKDKRFYLVSFILLVVSLLISEKAIVFPFLIFLFDLATGRLSKNWKWYVLFFGAVVVFLAFIAHLFFERLYLLTNAYYLESGLDNPFFLIPVALFNYVFLLFWPYRLTMYHTEVAPTVGLFIVQVIAAIFYAALLVVSFRKNRSLFFFLSFFFLALLPFLTPFRITWVVAERYVYLASIGIIAAVSMGISWLIKRYATYQDVIMGIVVIILLVFSLRTIVRNAHWKNEDVLWKATVHASPASHNAHNNMGDVYIRQKDYERAALEFSRAIEIKPDYADAYHNLANTYQHLNNQEQALAFYRKALELNPNIWQSYVQMAGIFSAQGDFQKSEEQLVKANEISPHNPDIFTSFGILYMLTGNTEKAASYIQEALRINPGNVRAQEAMRQLQSDAIVPTLPASQ